MSPLPNPTVQLIAVAQRSGDRRDAKVQYAYTNEAGNHARRTSITYPDSTVLVSSQ